MIRRLIEADYVNVEDPSGDKVKFWLLFRFLNAAGAECQKAAESRTPRMLVELAQQYREQAEGLISSRPLLTDALTGNESSVEDGLEKEQKLIRDIDRKYWIPLFQELEELRHLDYDSEEDV